MTVTKRQLVTQISELTNLAQLDVFAVVQHTLDQIAEALAEGNKVELRNFGVFEVAIRKPRVGRNPHRPDADVPIPLRAVVKFKAGKEMRAAVRLLPAQRIMEERQALKARRDQKALLRAQAAAAKAAAKLKRAKTKKPRSTPLA